MGSAKTSTIRDSKSATQTLSQMNARFYRLGINVAAYIEERQRIHHLHEFSVESAQALEAQREVLTHDVVEEIHRRDGRSLGMMRTLESESHAEVADP